MVLTGKHSNCAILNWNHRMTWIVGGEVAAGAVYTPSGVMIEEICCVRGRIFTDVGELTEMIVTAHQRNRELIEEQEGWCVVRLECRLTRRALNRRMARDVGRLRGGLYWTHIVECEPFRFPTRVNAGYEYLASFPY
ncbi:hypothetical protein KTS45_19275 [Halomicroarcula limicola]|uniref:Uncharacterized protein n=1 Tax=Haloarcula limicola TaxID=1429915 RepID=A0A8J8C8R6_9EURY|nr:hypothetical protein [Halomicroarcula limicola]MBV0926353.1 hypothetical protein [Halomicroarcula limicola]